MEADAPVCKEPHVPGRGRLFQPKLTISDSSYSQRDLTPTSSENSWSKNTGDCRCFTHSAQVVLLGAGGLRRSLAFRTFMPSLTLGLRLQQGFLLRPWAGTERVGRSQCL